MKKTTKETTHKVSILIAVGVGLVLASIASAASAHAQANNTSSSAAAKNMTSTAADESTIGAAGNITRVIVTLEVKEGKNQEALKNLIPLAELARQRQGNIGYDVYSSTENPNELVLDELWSSKAAFDKHYNSSEASKIRETVNPLLVNAAQIKTYTEAGKIQP
jgi:quinol monooxygenase YgiN